MPINKMEKQQDYVLQQYYYAKPMWLVPSSKGHVSNNPKSAIKNKMSFDISTNENKQLLLNEIFGTRYPLSLLMIDDLSLYPFEFDNYVELIKCYNAANNSDIYFKYMTGLDPNKFLNHGERLFYLTHGYGKPHKHASLLEYEKRKLLLSCIFPTSFSVFTDLFPDLSYDNIDNSTIIKEKLYGYDLTSIPIYHMNAFILLNLDIPSTLNKLGIYSDNLEYLIDKDFYITNCTQIQLYRTVITDRKWYYEEVRNKPIEFIKEYLSTLSDPEILSISVPISLNTECEFIKFQQSFKQTRKNYYRSKLLENSLRFLTDQKHRILKKYVIFGSMVGNLKVYTQDDFLWQLQNFGSLIDKHGNLLTTSEAYELNQTLQSSILLQIINKTIAMELMNDQKFKNFKGLITTSDLLVYGLRKTDNLYIVTTFKFNDEPLQQFPQLWNESIEYYRSRKHKI